MSRKTIKQYVDEQIAANSGLSDTFETISKNLREYPYTLHYTGENLTSIIYDLDTGQITKTFNYTGELLTSIVLSDDVSEEVVNLTKNFIYTGEQLTSITYS